MSKSLSPGSSEFDLIWGIVFTGVIKLKQGHSSTPQTNITGVLTNAETHMEGRRWKETEGEGMQGGRLGTDPSSQASEGTSPANTWRSDLQPPEP